MIRKLIAFVATLVAVGTLGVMPVREHNNSYQVITPVNQYVETVTSLANKYNLNKEYAIYVDFSKPANQHRLYLINIKTQKVEYSWYTSHGSGSNAADKARRFSNVPGSNKSSLGVMKTGKTYVGKHGLSRKLIGLEKGKNDNAEVRFIVLHSANYVTQEYVNTYGDPGMSYGCITLNPKDYKRIIMLLGENSLVYVNA